MKNIPKKIYLQHGLSDEELKRVDFNDFNKHGSMSWCADQIEKNDICYVLESENKELIGAMQWFCDRVDNHEVKSKRTYTRFKKLLKTNKK